MVSQPVADTVATNPVVGLGLTAAGVAAGRRLARRGGDDHHRGPTPRGPRRRRPRRTHEYVTFSFDDAVDVPLLPRTVHAGNDDPDPPEQPPPFRSLPIDRRCIIRRRQQTPRTPAAPRANNVRVTVDTSVASEEEARFEAALASGGRSTDDATGSSRAALRAWKKTVGDDTGVVDPRPANPNVAGSNPRGGGYKHDIPAHRKDQRAAPVERNNTNTWWDVDIDDVPYRKSTQQKSKVKPSAAEAKSRERRRAARRKNREASQQPVRQARVPRGPREGRGARAPEASPDR